ncbi:TPA_asm: P [Durio betacytorhabdovirus 1]|nr:TPA_asm: P [Durio betacytorhabdovirus 1]
MSTEGSLSVIENVALDSFEDILDDEGIFGTETLHEELIPEFSVVTKEEADTPTESSEGASVKTSKPTIFAPKSPTSTKYANREPMLKAAENYAKDRGIIMTKEFRAALIRQQKIYGELGDQDITMFFQGVLQERSISLSTGLIEMLEKTNQELSRLTGLVKNSDERNRSLVEELRVIKEEAREEKKEFLEVVNRIVEERIREMFPEVMRKEEEKEIEKSATPVRSPDKSEQKDKKLMADAIKGAEPKDPFWDMCVKFMTSIGMLNDDINHPSMPTVANLLLQENELKYLTDPKTPKEKIDEFGDWFIAAATQEYEKLV